LYSVTYFCALGSRTRTCDFSFVINIREEEGRRKEWKGRKEESVIWKKRHEPGRKIPKLEGERKNRRNKTEEREPVLVLPIRSCMLNASSSDFFAVWFKSAIFNCCAQQLHFFFAHLCTT
jgi:hypothetical protein